MKNRVVSTFAAASVALLAACYTQAPLDVAAPAPSTRIVAQVTDAGAAALGNTIGAGALEVEGVITEATPDEWKIQMLRVDDKFGVSNPWQGQVVTVPRQFLTRPQTRRLDKTRSYLAAAGITVGAVLAARLFGGLIVGDPDDTDPVPQATILVPGGVRR
jgi:hypothetical protein